MKPARAARPLEVVADDRELVRAGVRVKYRPTEAGRERLLDVVIELLDGQTHSGQR